MNLSLQARALSIQEVTIYTPFFAPEVLQKVRVVDGKPPFWLRPSMCAVVLNCTIYFRAGHYQPYTLRGVELLGHEITHVEQYLHGMTVWHYLWESRRGYVKNCYEVAAYAKGAMIKAEVARKGIV
ncbi:MAG: DUF4157 domain-containing protein [Methylophilaceae bacterium]